MPSLTRSSLSTSCRVIGPWLVTCNPCNLQQL
jgi:hypothetical protein